MEKLSSRDLQIHAYMVKLQRKTLTHYKIKDLIGSTREEEEEDWREYDYKAHKGYLKLGKKYTNVYYCTLNCMCII